MLWFGCLDQRGARDRDGRRLAMAPTAVARL